VDVAAVVPVLPPRERGLLLLGFGARFVGIVRWEPGVEIAGLCAVLGDLAVVGEHVGDLLVEGHASRWLRPEAGVPFLLEDFEDRFDDFAQFVCERAHRHAVRFSGPRLFEDDGVALSNRDVAREIVREVCREFVRAVVDENGSRRRTAPEETRADEEGCGGGGNTNPSAGALQCRAHVSARTRMSRVR
jgi:hypothetical protein